MGEKDSVLNELGELHLPEGSYMVMGSGILDALNIRKAVDVDLVLNDEVYAYLRGIGWSERTASNGAVGIEHDIFQAYNRWNDKDVIKTLEELLADVMH